MDPVSTLSSIFSAIQSLKKTWDTMQDCKLESRRLVDRLEALRPSLDGLRAAAPTGSYDPGVSKVLGSLQEIIADCDALFHKFTEKTWYRLAEKWVNVAHYQKEYGEINVRLTQLCADLGLLVTVSDSLTDPARRRREDLDDLAASMQLAVDAVMSHMAHDREVRDELHALQHDVNENYARTVALMLECNHHAPLGAAEATAMADSQAALLRNCEAQLAEVKEGIHRTEGLLQELIAATAEHDSKVRRQACLQALRRPASDVVEMGPMDAGGFGVVCLGKYRGNRVALKIIRNKGGDGDVTVKQVVEAENEVLIMDFVKEINIAQVYGLVVEPMRLVIIMDLAPFGSLWAVLSSFDLFPARPGAFPPSLVVAWVKDIANGLAHLHHHCVRHKDFKCQNLLVYASPQRLQIKITDFGLAKQSRVVERALVASSSSHALAGTLAFMAPECRERGGKLYTSASDVFSLGVTIMQILTRASPDMDWEEEKGRAVVALSAALGGGEAFAALPAALSHAGAGDAPYAPSAPSRPSLAPNPNLTPAHRARVERTMTAVLADCTAKSPSARPSARNVGAKMDALLTAVFCGDPRTDMSTQPDYDAVRRVEGLLNESFERRMLAATAASYEGGWGPGAVKGGGGEDETRRDTRDSTLQSSSSSASAAGSGASAVKLSKSGGSASKPLAPASEADAAAPEAACGMHRSATQQELHDLRRFLEEMQVANPDDFGLPSSGPGPGLGLNAGRPDVPRPLRDAADFTVVWPSGVKIRETQALDSAVTGELACGSTARFCRTSLVLVRDENNGDEYMRLQLLEGGAGWVTWICRDKAEGICYFCLESLK